MIHNDISYEISEIPKGSGQWHYTIHPDVAVGPKVTCFHVYRSHAEAEAACKYAIDLSMDSPFDDYAVHAVASNTARAG